MEIRMFRTVNSILFVQLSAIGDVVLTTPAIRGLREKHKGAYITYLVEEAGSGVLANNPHLDEVFVFPRVGYKKDLRGGLKNFMEVWGEIKSLVEALQKKKFDLAINVHTSIHAAILTYLAKAKKTLGFTMTPQGEMISTPDVWSRYREAAAYRPYFGRYLRNLHEIDIFLSISGVEPSSRNLEVFWGEAESKKAAEVLGSHGVRADDLLIGLNPSANWLTKRWLRERYAELGDRLMTYYKAKVILLGGPGDKEWVSEIEGCMKRKPINLSGQTSLKELPAFIARCELFITNDTGPMHIAAAAGVPIIAITGPTSVTPVGRGHLRLQADLDCAPCWSNTCRRGDTACMEIVGVEGVMKAIELQNYSLRGESEKVKLMLADGAFKDTNVFYGANGGRNLKRDRTEAELRRDLVSYLGLKVVQEPPSWSLNRVLNAYSDEPQSVDVVLKEVVKGINAKGAEQIISDCQAEFKELGQAIEDRLTLEDPDGLSRELRAVLQHKKELRNLLQQVKELMYISYGVDSLKNMEDYKKAGRIANRLYRLIGDLR
jgi:lipopolysaccharide heptosyltransferase II